MMKEFSDPHSFQLVDYLASLIEIIYLFEYEAVKIVK